MLRAHISLAFCSNNRRLHTYVNQTASVKKTELRHICSSRLTISEAILRYIGVARIFSGGGGCTFFFPQKLMTFLFFSRRPQYTG